jgi:UPF0271 protein
VRTIDINSDCGESFANWRLGSDEELIPELTAANVACGFHASDPLTMLRTIDLCKANGVEVGSHPGLPDLLGFGRRAMKISPEDGYAYTLYQAGALKAMLATRGMELHHVKSHGAFYTILRDDDELAAAFCRAVRDLMPVPVVYWPDCTDSSLPREAAKAGVRVVHEVYVDLDYAPDGSLILQREKRPADLEVVAAQIRSWLETGSVRAVDGSMVPVEAESVCIHGDGPNALEVARTVKLTIAERGCTVGPLTIDAVPA